MSCRRQGDVAGLVGGVGETARPSGGGCGQWVRGAESPRSVGYGRVFGRVTLRIVCLNVSMSIGFVRCREKPVSKVRR
jgi:hypothetical protein